MSFKVKDKVSYNFLKDESNSADKIPLPKIVCLRNITKYSPHV